MATTKASTVKKRKIRNINDTNTQIQKVLAKKFKIPRKKKMVQATLPFQKN